MAKLYYTAAPGALDWIIGDKAFIAYSHGGSAWVSVVYPHGSTDAGLPLANVHQTRALFKAIFNSTSIEIRTNG